jgi:hypothetical protein
MFQIKNEKNIWSFENNEKVPTLYDTSGDYRFKRPANIVVDELKQLELSNTLLPIKLTENIIFKEEEKSTNANIGYVIQISETHVTVKKYIRKETEKNIYWNLPDENNENLTLTIDRKLVVKTGIQFTKAKKLKQSSRKNIQNFILL